MCPSHLEFSDGTTGGTIFLVCCSPVWAAAHTGLLGWALPAPPPHSHGPGTSSRSVRAATGPSGTMFSSPVLSVSASESLSSLPCHTHRPKIKTRDKVGGFALELQYAGLWREVFLFPFVSTSNRLVHIVRQMINMCQATCPLVNPHFHAHQSQLCRAGVFLCPG